MRDVFVAGCALDRAIGTTPEPTPAVVRRWILRVKDEVDRIRVPEERPRNAKADFIIRCHEGEAVDLFPLAPPPFIPPTNEAANFGLSSF